MNCIKFIVSGRVQGVFYRASTRDQARQLNLVGHALNLPDGSVEVLACGEGAAIKHLEAWLWQGPAHANVTNVVSYDMEPPNPAPTCFDIG